MKPHSLLMLFFSLLIISSLYAGDVPEEKPRLITDNKKPMSFMDMLNRPYASCPTLSPDGSLAVYTIYKPSWEKQRSFSDIHLVSLITGEDRQITDTPTESEYSPHFTSDGKYILYALNSGGATHIYLINIGTYDVINLTRIHKNGISSFQISDDKSCIAYSIVSGDSTELWLLPCAPGGEPKFISSHSPKIQSWKLNQLNSKIYFIVPDNDNLLEYERKKLKFDVVIKDQIPPPSNLWELDLSTRIKQKVTNEEKFTFYNYSGFGGAMDFDISSDGNWCIARAIPYERDVDFYDLEYFLINLKTFAIERLTEDRMPVKGGSFTPDSKFVYFNTNEGISYIHNEKTFTRSVYGGDWKKLFADYDIKSIENPFFAEDGITYYFHVREGVRTNLFSSKFNEGKIQRVTNLNAVINVTYDVSAHKAIIYYTDDQNPGDYYLSDLENISDKSAWTRITDADPEINEFELSECRTVKWTSEDGTVVEGLLWTPPQMDRSRNYPVIVQLHGGPAAASQLWVNTSWENYVPVFTANNYIVFQPNYRGSANYGEKFTTEIRGNYFQKGFEDIMTGVDYLIQEGIAHQDSLGLMGYSAGGSFSNWLLVKTNRFKAISTGAGIVNWISYYAQVDVQKPTEYYFKTAPYDNFDNYWDCSPLKYIKEAKTPALIYYGEGDMRVPLAQGLELYMGLKKNKVPAELIIYPNTMHGISNPRFKYVKMYTEFQWFEKWIRGKELWFDWSDILNVSEK